MVSRRIAEGAEVHTCQMWLDPTKTESLWFDATHTLRKKNGVTALHIASLNWNPEGIHALIDHRGDLSVLEMVSNADDTDGGGCTAMHYLVRHLDQVDAIRHLISLGMDLTVINHKGDTPLHEVMKSTRIGRMGEDGLLDPSQPPDSPYTTRGS
ncbi:ankyrin [Penicillium sp. IBT 35674x]|nr:ankyrin [Penicillium sp. IBT 35674x]